MASTSSASSSVVELGAAAAAEHDTATSPYFSSGGTSAFSWPLAEKTTSSLTIPAQPWNVCAHHGVPAEYKPLPVDPTVPACVPPQEGACCVYADAFDAGMRLPLHLFYASVLKHYGLAPSQLAPNAWRYMAAFVLLCEDAGVGPLVSVFRHFFSVHAHKGESLGWHHFKPFAVPLPSGERRRLFVGNTGTRAGWKTRFFFLSSAAPWPCPVRWGKPSREAAMLPARTATSAAIEKLLEKAGPTGIDIMAFLARHKASLPVGHHVVPLQQVTVKTEAVAAAAAARKRKLPEEAVVTPPQLPRRLSGAAGPTMSTPPPPRPAGPSAAVSASGGGERSAMRGLVDSMTGALQMAEKAMDELEGKEQELQASKQEVARLQEELQAANEQHAAELSRLAARLRKTEAEAGQLAKALQQAKDEHAAKVQAAIELLSGSGTARFRPPPQAPAYGH